MFTMGPMPSGAGPPSKVSVLPASLANTVIAHVLIIPSTFGKPSANATPASAPTPLMPMMLPLHRIGGVDSLSLHATLATLVSTYPTFNRAGLGIM